MKVAILGDYHGDPIGFSMGQHFADKFKCNTIIQAGDFKCYQMPSRVPLHWIAGNHENWSILGRHKNGQYQLGTNQVYQDDYSRRRIGNTDFGFIGRIQRSEWHLAHRGMLGGLKDPLWLERGPKNWEERLWIKEDVEHARQMEGCDVLVLHDMPHFERSDEDYLCSVIRNAQPPLVAHGHMHTWNHKTVNVGESKIDIVSLPPCDGFDHGSQAEIPWSGIPGLVYDTIENTWTAETIYEDQ